MRNGFLPINRELFEDELWSELRVFNRAEAYIDLLSCVRFEANATSILIGNRSIEINHGEMAISLRYLAQRWRWSKNRVDSFLKYLETRGVIEKRTAGGTQQTIIKFCDCEIYTSTYRKSGTVGGTPSGHLRDTIGTNNKKVKKDKKEKGEDKSIQVKDCTGGIVKGGDWRTDFDAYLSELRTAYMSLVHDPAFIAQQQRFYPGMNIPMTLEKACVNFWATEAGWENKKATKSARINWKATLTNALSNPQNKVYERTNTIAGKTLQRDAALDELAREAACCLLGSAG